MVVHLPRPLFSDRAADDNDNDAAAEDDAPAFEPTASFGDDVVTLHTVGDAVARVRELVAIQIDLAIARGAKQNESTAGDSIVRAIFYGLLPDEQQRVVFLAVAGRMEAWPRLRSFFGAPPFGFLRPEDGGVLRAAGIAAGRANMTFHEFTAAASYSQFGLPQLADELEREYKVASPRADDQPLAFDLEAAHEHGDISLQVRVPRRTRAVKAQMVKDEGLRKRLTFPRPGERISLMATSRVQKLTGSGGAATLNTRTRRTVLKVKRVVPRSAGAATAAILASFE